MTRDEKFFYDHAGYSVGPGETKRQGKTRGAKRLALAEQYAKDHDWVFEWEYDQDGCSGCDCGSTECACASGDEHETLCCILRDSEPSMHDSYGRPRGGAVLASLGGICSVTSDYRRVVEAELALEAVYDAEASAIEAERVKSK